MSIFNMFRQPPPPPPPPFYKARPVATAALIFTLFATLIIGPTKYIASGMEKKIDTNTEDIKEVQKEKATVEDVKESLTEMKETRKAVQSNQIAIERILLRQELSEPKGFKIKTEEVSKTIKVVKKPKAVLTPVEFQNYMDMPQARRIQYRKYLERSGKNVSDLPD